MKRSPTRCPRVRWLALLPGVLLAGCNAPGDLSGPVGGVLAIGAAVAACVVSPGNGEICHTQTTGGDTNYGLYVGERECCIRR